MDLILLLFVYPLVVSVISIALEILLNRPWLVASIVFAVALLIVFTIGTTDMIIAVVIYALLSLLIAYITNWIINRDDSICCIRTRRCNNNNNINSCNRRMFQ